MDEKGRVVYVGDEFSHLVPGYEELEKVLELAYNRAAKGKGVERHGVGGVAFVDQPIISIQRFVGLGYPLGQIMKKATEIPNLEDQQARHNEILDIIVYAASIIVTDALKD